MFVSSYGLDPACRWTQSSCRWSTHLDYTSGDSIWGEVSCNWCYWLTSHLQSPSERSVELVDELHSSSSDLCSCNLSCCNEAWTTHLWLSSLWHSNRSASWGAFLLTIRNYSFASWLYEAVKCDSAGGVSTLLMVPVIVSDTDLLVTGAL